MTHVNRHYIDFAQVSKYSSLLQSAQKNAFIRGGLTATTMGLFFGFIYGMYGLGLWYGVKVIVTLSQYLQTVTSDSPADAR